MTLAAAFSHVENGQTGRLAAKLPANDCIRQLRRTLHLRSLPRDEQSEETEMRNRSSIDRNFRSEHDRKIQRINQGDLTQLIKDALERAFGDTDAAIKRVQAVANCNERAARNWVEGKNAPNALYLLRLIAEVPELQAEVRRLTAMEANLDPEFGRAMNEAVRLFQQMRRT